MGALKVSKGRVFLLTMRLLWWTFLALLTEINLQSAQPYGSGLNPKP